MTPVFKILRSLAAIGIALGAGLGTRALADADEPGAEAPQTECTASTGLTDEQTRYQRGSERRDEEGIYGPEPSAPQAPAPAR
jgi:hypothetical protein